MSEPPSATSANSGASCVQPTSSGAPPAAAVRNLSSSARQSWRAVVTLAPRQPRVTAAASSGIVSSHEQIRISLWAIGHFVSGLRLSLRSASGRHWPRRISSYNDYKQQSRVRSPNAARGAHAPAHVVEAGARPAAAVPAGDAARGRRRLCPCHRGGGGGGRRHAGLCRPLRSRRVRGGAGTRGAAADRAPRHLCRAHRARRRARGARAAGEADQLRLARRGAGRRRAGGRGAPRLAAGRRRERAAGLARVRRHDPHRGDGRRGAGPASALGRARGGGLRRSRLRPPGRELRAPSHGGGRHLAGAGIRRGREELSRAPGARERRAPRPRRQRRSLWCGAMGKAEVERRSLVRALAQPSWLDPATGGPRK